MQAMDQFPQCQAIMPELQNPSADETVERILQRFQDEDRPLRRRQLAAVRFYLQFMISQCEQEWLQVARSGSNYQVLLSQLEIMRAPEEEVCLVTFNYDTMLERAIFATLGLPIRGLTDYISSQQYKLIKLHGSVNWAREVHTSVNGSLNDRGLAWQLINQIDQLNITQNYVIIAHHPPEKSGHPLFPAIAIPVEKKSTYECPDDHIKALNDCLPQINNLLVIGWRAAEEHFLSLLRERLGSVRTHIVAGSKSDVDEIVDRLKRAQVRINDVQATVEGFTAFTQANRLRGFLQG